MANNISLTDAQIIEKAKSVIAQLSGLDIFQFNEVLKCASQLVNQTHKVDNSMITLFEAENGPL